MKLRSCYACKPEIIFIQRKTVLAKPIISSKFESQGTLYPLLYFNSSFLLLANLLMEEVLFGY